MKARLLLALTLGLSALGCLSNRDLPPGVVVSCADNGECPADYVCESGRCVDVREAPSVDLDPLGRAAGDIVVSATISEPNGEPVELSAQLIDGSTVYELAVSPSALDEDGPVELTLAAPDLEPGPQPRAMILRVFASDGKNTGVGELALDYGNEAPQILGLRAESPNGESRGPVRLVFTARDSSDDPITVTALAFSVDDGGFADVADAAASFQGDVAALETSALGQERTLVWDSALAAPVSGSVVVQLTVEDEFGGVTTAESEPFDLNNAPRVVAARLDPGLGRPIDAQSVSFALDAPASASVDLVVEFAADYARDEEGIGSGTFAAASVSGDVVALSPGADKTFTWSIVDDFPTVPVPTAPSAGAAPVVIDVPVFSSRAALRITPVDENGLAGAPVEIGPFAAGNDPPALSVEVIPDGSGGDIPIEITLSDSARDLTTVEVDFQLPGETVFRKADLRVGNFLDLPVDVGPTTFTALWSSITEPDDDPTVDQGIGRQRLDGVTIRVRAYDEVRPGLRAFALAAADHVQTRLLTNQSAPRLEPIFIGDQGGVRTGVVPIAYRLFDEESDPVNLAFELSTDGVSFRPATEHPAPISEGKLGLASAPQSAGGVEHTFLWDTGADVKAFEPSVQLRVRLVDPFIDPLVDEVPTVSLLQPTPVDPLPGSPEGAFLREVRPPLSAGFVNATGADLDRDGVDDLLLAGSGALERYRGDGVDDFNLAQTITNGDYLSVVVGDLNADGVLDVVDRFTGRFALGAGQGAGYSLTDAGFVTACGRCSVTVDDYDGDGQLDFAAQDGNNLRLFLSVGQGAGWSVVESTTIAGRAELRPGDFNGDGQRDAIVVPRFGDPITVRIFGGSGTPGAGDWALTERASTTITGRQLNGPLVGELTGDNIDDFVVNDDEAGVFRLWRGTGDDFVLEDQISSVTFSGPIVTADVDRNGILDFVIPTATDRDVALVLGAASGGRPAGRFLSTVRLPSGSVTLSAAVLDVDNNGRLDVLSIVGLGTGDIEVHLQAARLPQTDDSFAAARTLTPGGMVSARPLPADVDLDGALDFVTTSEFGEMTVAFGAAAGGLTTRWDIELGAQTSHTSIPGPLAARDLDGDGAIDAVAESRVGPDCAVDIWRGGRASGAPTRELSLTESHVVGDCGLPVIGDLNGDGFPDIVAPASGTSAAVLINDGDGTFTLTTQALPAGGFYSTLALAELTSDAHLDLIAGVDNQSGNATVHVLRGLGDGTFTLQQSISTPGGAGQVRVADLDADGFPDILALRSNGFGGDQLSVIRGNGVGAGWTGAPIDSGAFPQVSSRMGMLLGDLDLDGRQDLIVTGLAPDDTPLFLYPGAGTGDVGNATFEPFIPVSAKKNHSYVSAIDVNFDGAPDVFSTQYFSGAFDLFAGRPARPLDASTRGVTEDESGAAVVLAVGPEVAWLEDFGGGFRDEASVGFRRISGADDPLAGPAVGDSLDRAGDFAKLLREEGLLLGRNRPLTGAFYASGDLRLSRVNDEVTGARLELVPRFGDPLGAANLRRAGLSLDDPADERGLVIDLPLLTGRNLVGAPRVFLRVPRWRTADTVSEDPRSGEPAASRFLPRVPDGEGGFRDLVEISYEWIEIPEHDALDFGAGTVTGKRFIVDQVNRRVRVLTDELGALQAFEKL